MTQAMHRQRPRRVSHIDSTRALEPLEPTSVWVAGQNPETYPTGL